MLSDTDAAKSGRVVHAMLQMTRLDLKRLQEAANQFYVTREADSSPIAADLG